MENFKRELFEKLGSLFYTIAKDQHVAPFELGELKMLMHKDWLIEPNNDPNYPLSEPSHLILLTLDDLIRQATSAESAFNSFAQFYARHREQFSDVLKEKIVETANAITRVFPSPARLQNNHIIKLKLLFQNSTQIPLM